MSKLKGLDLCSGIGGFSLGLSEYVQPIAYAEIEAYPRKVIEVRIRDKVLSKAPVLEDLKNIDISDFRGKVDITYAGFPCQDISVAGKGAGLEGKQSSLFFEIVSLAKKIQSPFVFLENVPAIRTRGLEKVVRTITEAGYDSRWFVLSAACLGAPHLRERWFLLAYSDSFKRKRIQVARRNLETVSSLYGLKKPVADSFKVRCKKNVSLRPKKKKPWFKGKSWWAAEPSVCRVADGVPARMDRLKALGNAVVPLQVKVAFEQLMGIKDERYFDC